MEDYKKPDDKDDLIMAFRVFDSANKGYVEAKEIRKALLRLKDIPMEEIDEVLKAANLQENRHIHFDGELHDTVSEGSEK